MNHRPDPISRLAENWASRTAEDRRGIISAWVFVTVLVGGTVWIMFDPNLAPLVDAVLPLDP